MPEREKEMSGIIFKDRIFSEPMELGVALPARTQGVYAVLLPDNSWWPQQFRVIYFGETGDLAKNITSKHEKYQDWLQEAAGSTLYVAFHATPRMKQEKRKEAGSELVREFHPVCNAPMELSVA